MKTKEEDYCSNFDTIVKQWLEAQSAKDKKTIADRTIQCKDPVLNYAVEACRLRDSLETLKTSAKSDSRTARLLLLLVVSAARLAILGRVLDFVFIGTSTAAQLRLRADQLLNWKYLATRLSELVPDKFNVEYYQWTLRAVQKKQMPLPASVLLDTIKVIKETAASLDTNRSSR